MNTYAGKHNLVFPAEGAAWAAVRRAAGTLCSFETLFVLFLFAGRYKNDPRFSWVPGDITAITAALSIVAGIAVVLRRGGRLRRRAAVLVGLYLLFAGFAALSLLWTPSVVYAHEKVLYLATLVFWPILATTVIVAYDRVRVYRFLLIVLLFSAWLALESFRGILQSRYGTAQQIMGSPYLGVGVVLGLGVLVVFGYFLYEARNWWQRLTCFALLGGLLGVLLVLPGRGALVATLMPMCVPLVAGVRLRPAAPRPVALSRSAVGALLVILAGAAGMVIALLTSARLFSLLRLAMLFSQEGIGVSAGARVLHYRQTLGLWLQGPFLGMGVGGWPLRAGYGDLHSHPHNLLLETLAELGLVGAVLLVLLIVYAFRSLGTWADLRRDSLRLVVLMLALNTLLNASFSGDLTDNRFVFAILGLMVLPHRGGESRAEGSACRHNAPT